MESTMHRKGITAAADSLQEFGAQQAKTRIQAWMTEPQTGAGQ